MKYLGFEEVSLDEIFADLRDTGKAFQKRPHVEFFSTNRDQMGSKYVIHKVDKAEFSFYSALFNPDQSVSKVEATGGASKLLSFMPKLYGMIVDIENETGFVVMQNILESTTSCFLDLVATRFEHLPTDSEPNQIRRIARGYNQGHLNRGFKVQSFTVVDNEGREILGGNLANTRKHRIQFGDHSIEKLFGEIYLQSHTALIEEALVYFIKFVQDLHKEIMDKEHLKYIFASIHITFVIDYENHTYSAHIGNFKKSMRVENHDVWSQNYQMDLGKVIEHLTNHRNSVADLLKSA